MQLVQFFRLKQTILSLVLVFPGLTHALQYQIEGAPSALHQNMLAWLPALSAENGVENAPGSGRLLKAAQSAGESLGYYQAEFNLQITDELVVITVEPGQQTQVRTLTIDGLDDVENIGNFIRKSGFGDNSPFHHGDYSDFKDNLLAELVDRGYVNASFTTQQALLSADRQYVDIRLVVSAGQQYRIGQVLFAGHELKDDLIARISDVQPDTLYSTTSLNRLYKNLVNSGYFDSVLLVPGKPDPATGYIDIQIELVPKADLKLLAGIGLSTDLGPRVTLGAELPALNALGHKVNSQWQWAPIKQSVNLSYEIPQKKPLTEWLELSIGWQRVFLDDEPSSTWTLGAQRFWQSKSKTRDSLFWRWDYLGDNNTAQLSGSSIVWLGATRLYQQSNPVKNRKQQLGFQLDWSSQFWSSDAELVKFQQQFERHWQFGKHRWSFRQDAGLIRDLNDKPMTDSLKFRTGGDQSIRGYEYQSIGVELPGNEVDGGQNSLVVSLEYGYQLTTNWLAASFVDGGDAFDQSFNLNLGVGVGLRRLLPGGMLSLDLASPPDQWSPRIHFGLGARW